MITAIVLKPFHYLLQNGETFANQILKDTGVTRHEAALGELFEFGKAADFIRLQKIAKLNNGELARQYRLGSAELCNTPGLLAWAQNGYHFKRDRPALLRTFTTGFPGPNAPTKEEFDKLLSQQWKFAVEDGTVIFPVV